MNTWLSSIDSRCSYSVSQLWAFMFVVHTSNCHGQNGTRRAIFRLGIDTLIANILVSTSMPHLTCWAFIAGFYVNRVCMLLYSHFFISSKGWQCFRYESRNTTSGISTPLQANNVRWWYSHQLPNSPTIRRGNESLNLLVGETSRVPARPKLDITKNWTLWILETADIVVISIFITFGHPL